MRIVHAPEIDALLRATGAALNAAGAACEALADVDAPGHAMAAAVDMLTAARAAHAAAAALLTSGRARTLEVRP